ncbi:calcium homeostasis modulator protein 6-like [Macrotis lagotis]|uniref:calcium homeostasis modulator protein 6-like n=1 Tax=Macrotis lagotis TaxID=92651 RepID=UPI003D69DCD5
MEKFAHLLDLCIKHHRVLGMGMLSLLTAGGESLFSNVVFQCPCSAVWNLPYSLVFFLVPALVLFLLGYLLSSDAGQVVTGCCALKEGDPCCNTCGNTCCNTCCNRMGMCSQITLAAAVAPVTWIAVALLGGNYYECAASGSLWMQKRLCLDQKSNCTEEVVKMPCQKERSEEVKVFLQDFQAQSQFAGWILVAFTMFLFTTVKLYTSCTSPMSFLQLKFMKIYKKEENEMLKTESQEYATKLAERNVKYFFENEGLMGVKIPSADKWKKISTVHQINDTHYSSLHKYVDNKIAS